MAGKSNRKHGRNKPFCKAYRDSGREAKNRAVKVERNRQWLIACKAVRAANDRDLAEGAKAVPVHDTQRRIRKMRRAA